MLNTLHCRKCWVVMVFVALLSAQTDAKSDAHLFIPASLSFSQPLGGFSTLYGTKPSLGFSLGFEFTENRHLLFGVHGTWTRMGLGKTDTADYSSFGLTNVGLIASIKYRFAKHGWSPYVRIDGGMGYVFEDKTLDNNLKIEGLTAVKINLGASAGVEIPLSDRLNLDIYARYSTTYITPVLQSLSGHLGIVYVLPK